MSDYLAHKIAYHLDTADQVLKAWADNFSADPAYALQWETGAGEAAVELVVWREIEKLAAKNVTVEKIADRMTRQVLDLAASGENSTSPNRNLYDRSYLKALAVAVRELREHLEYEQARSVSKIVDEVFAEGAPIL